MDIDAIKSRLNQLQNTTTNSFWKPQPGKTQIRIVPYFTIKAILLVSCIFTIVW